MSKDPAKTGMLPLPVIPKKRYQVWKQVAGGLVASTVTFSNGCLLGFGAILLGQLEEPDASMDVAQQRRAWLMSGAYVGSLVGCCLATLLVKTLGPSRIMLWHTVPNLLGWGLVALAGGFWPLVAGRFVCGLACGVCISAAQIYISETSCPRVRGVMLTLPECAATASLLFCYLLGLLLHWRVVAVVCGLLPNLVIFVGFLWLPESPTWLVHQHRLNDAENSLMFFYGSRFEADQHVQSLMDGMEKTQRSVWETLRLLKKAEYLRPMAISSVQLMILNFSGMNAMFGYAVVIFRLASAGIGEYHCAILLAGVRLLCNLASSSLIDRCGRRALLAASGAVCCLTLAVIGAFFYLREQSPQAVESLAWLPLVGMLVTICSFAFGVGPVSWVVFGEMLPSAVRELAGSLVIILWTASLFTVLQLFPSLRQLAGNHGLFWFFSAVCLAQMLFALFAVPETRLRTLEDIHREHFSKRYQRTDADDEEESLEGADETEPDVD